MKKFLICISLAIILLSNVSCALRSVLRSALRHSVLVQYSESSAFSAYMAQKLYSNTNGSLQYRMCVMQAYMDYAKQNDEDTAWYYTAANGQRIKEEWALSLVMVMITEREQSYRNTQEKASPYNYVEFVEFLKDNDEMYKTYPIETMNILQGWVKMQYEQCGVHVYNMEERCAAMKAVDIETEWCKK